MKEHCFQIWKAKEGEFIGREEKEEEELFAGRQI